MSLYCLKIACVVSDLLKNSELKRRRREYETALHGLYDGAQCRGNSFDEVQEHPLFSKATCGELSEELDMLNTHYLTHLSPKSW